MVSPSAQLHPTSGKAASVLGCCVLVWKYPVMHGIVNSEAYVELRANDAAAYSTLVEERNAMAWQDLVAVGFNA